MNSLDNWFITQILPHEGALMRYLGRVWRNRAEHADLRQEIYARIFESAGKRLPDSPKNFLFVTARNLLADRARRERVVSIDYTEDLEALNVLADEISPEQRVSARQDLRRLADAFDSLSAMSRAVIWLRRVDGLSQRETAEQLGISERSLGGFLARGMKALAKAGLGLGRAGDTDSEDSPFTSERSGGRGGESVHGPGSGKKRDRS
jgi:RNA polymerase sigma factor (sigma-70 family)